MITIVCADDTADIRNLVRATLAPDGIHVLTARDGAEAIAMVQRQHPDAVLLDIHMPGMDGLETLREMAAHLDLAQIPVMMITSDSQAENVREALRAGARDFLVKPFDPEVLRRRVRRLLGVEAGEGAREEDVAKGRALIVADQPLLLAIAEGMLRQRYDVDTARNGDDAVALATVKPPDVVLVDARVVAASGWLAGQLRVAARQARIFAMAGAADGPAADGYDGVVRKPLERDGLLRAIGS